MGDLPSLQGGAIYAQLLEEIRSGGLPAGSRLTETEIADRLSVSRTPVREAIRRLEADGLVAHEPRTGAMVRRLSHAEIMELYEMRAVLEGAAARMAARGAGEAEITELAVLNDAMNAADDPRDRAELNRRFHHLLADAARNRFLARATQAIHRSLLLLGPTTLEEAARVQDAAAEHAEILQAVVAHDGDAAEAAMRRHMQGAQQVRIRQLQADASRCER